MLNTMGMPSENYDQEKLYKWKDVFFMQKSKERMGAVHWKT